MWIRIKIKWLRFNPMLYKWWLSFDISLGGFANDVYTLLQNKLATYYYMQNTFISIFLWQGVEILAFPNDISVLSYKFDKLTFTKIQPIFRLLILNHIVPQMINTYASHFMYCVSINFLFRALMKIYNLSITFSPTHISLMTTIIFGWGIFYDNRLEEDECEKT